MKYIIHTVCALMAAIVNPLSAQEVNATSSISDDQRNIEIKLVTLGSVLEKFDEEVTRQIDILTTRQQQFDECAADGALFDGTTCVAQEGISSNTTMFDSCGPHIIETYVADNNRQERVIVCSSISNNVLPRIHYNVAGPGQCNLNYSDSFGAVRNQDTSRIFAFCKPTADGVPYGDRLDSDDHYPQVVITDPTVPVNTGGGQVQMCGTADNRHECGSQTVTGQGVNNR